MELLQLRERYHLVGEERLARDLGRPAASVRSMAEKLFSSLPQRRGRWTAAEISRLKLLYGAHPIERLAVLLRRPPADVRDRVGRLSRKGARGGSSGGGSGRGAWAREDVALLKRLYGTRRDEDLSVVLGRPVAAVRRKAEELCLRKDRRFLRGLRAPASRVPRWSPQELERLARLYPHRGNVEVAGALGRSVQGVVAKARELGLRKSRRRLREMGRRNVALRGRRR